jgi:hypothetical protein
MSACLLEGHFQLPARNKPTDDLLRVSFKVCTQESLGFELSLRVSEKDPAQGYGEQARGVPNGRLGSDLDLTLPFSIPVSDRGGLPDRGRIFGHHREVGQSLSLFARPPYLLSAASWRSRLVEGGI